MNNTPIFEIHNIKNIKDLVDYSCEKFKDKDAFLVKKNKNYEGIKYSQLRSDINSLVNIFINEFNLENKKIAIIGENSYEWALSYLSTVYSNNIIVPIDKELPLEEIQNILLKSKINTVIYSNSQTKNIKRISMNLTYIKHFINMEVDNNGEYFLSLKALLKKGNILANKNSLNIKIDNNKMCSLIFTSGTTDYTKGVMLSHSNIVSNIMSVCSVIYINEKDTCLSILPLHHAYECTCGFLLMLYRGVTIAFNESLKYISKNIQEIKPTLLILVPLILENMYKKIWKSVSKKKSEYFKLKIAIFISDILFNIFKIDIRTKLFNRIHENIGGKIRLIISGAAAIDPIIMKGFKSFGFNVLQGYGLTECSPIVTVNRLNNSVNTSIGLLLPEVNAKIINPDANGIGEISVKGPNIMLGYYENEETNKEVFENNWLKTGDLGYVDKNDYYYITGRKKNVIVTKNGKNIFPEEIETYLTRSVYISESMVKSVKNPKGEIIVEANIFPDLKTIKNKFKTSEISLEDINRLISNEIKIINNKIPLYKRIRKFNIREKEFEKTTTKKIKRYIKDNQY
ncbi:MAG: AMP-binding protein [Clostridiales bacterium]